MDKQEILDKLNAIAKPATTWLEEAKFRVENRETIQHSQETALKKLRKKRTQENKS